MRNVLLSRGAAKLVDECLSIKPGEKAAIITDVDNISIAELLALVISERGNEFTMHIMKSRRNHGEEPPESIAAAMCKADVVLMPTTYSLTHTKARQQANDTGARILSLPGYNEETLIGGGLEADFKKVRATVEKVSKILDQGERARVTSSLGTDFTVDIKGKKSVPVTGVADIPGSWAAPPAVETAVGPIEGTASGVVYVDGVLIPGGLVHGEVVIEFEKGRISKISGGRQAQDFEKALKDFNDPNVYYAVELGIGLNPKSALGRNYLEDETTYGTIHIGIGEGRTYGCAISACAHLDMVLSVADLSVDGKTVVSNRQVIV